jgi:DNA invertase Pin-like site-specific DNA recombinase
MWTADVNHYHDLMIKRVELVSRIVGQLQQMEARVDRLARSSRDLLNVIKQITDIGATLKSIRDQWCDTTSAHGRLILTVLAGLAEFERELIVAGEGRERALAKGVALKPKLTHRQHQEAIARRNAGETMQSIARSYNVHHQ